MFLKVRNFIGVNSAGHYCARIGSLYCSTTNNPVRPERIIMQYIPGTCLGDCLDSDNLTSAEDLRTAMDMANIMVSLGSQLRAVEVSYQNSIQPRTSLLLTTSLSYPFRNPSASSQRIVGPVDAVARITTLVL
jgi:hypothetical protein